MSVKIAIDGPAGAGKSTIARKLAQELGFIYVDTGALYRAVAYSAVSNGKATDDRSGVIPLLDGLTAELKFIDGVQHVFVNGEDVSDKIRTPEMSMGASNVSAMPEVRDFLFNLQRTIAAENNVIMDGRDIGTVVLPDADLKIFLTASAEDRAQRRYLEFAEKENPPTYEWVLEDIKKRDYNDSHRKTAPLRQAEDAVPVDTTGNTLEQSVEKLRLLIKEKLEGMQ